jgi:two-component system sensor histidine kinase/response regulator
MHKLLQRQIRRAIGAKNSERLDSLLKELAQATGNTSPEVQEVVAGIPQVIGMVDEAYQQWERDLTLRARSLELSSAELTEANRRLREDGDRQRRTIDTIRGIVNRMLRSSGAEELGSDASSLEALCAHLTKLVEEREEAQAQLVLARDRAEAASRAKSEFLANMSHEIRTPMNGVLGMTELLLATSLQDRQRTYADRILRSTTTLLGVINEILDFSRIEAGRLELDLAPVDVGELAEDCCELLAEAAHQKGLEVICSVDPRLPSRLRADALRMRQIFTNLIGNAIKFTERGHVQVSLRVAERSGRTLVLRAEIADTGMGIPENDQTRVFEAFAQADGSMTRRHGGTGLGLAITKRLVETMGGEIGVRSVPHRGSVFWFTTRLELAEEILQTNDVALAGLRCLVMDAYEPTAYALKAQLESWGSQVEVASDGGTALAMLASGLPYDVAIIERGTSADALIRHQKRNPRLAEMQLVLMNNTTGDGSTGTSDLVGATLLKPVRRARLRRAVLDASSGRRAVVQRQEQVRQGTPLNGCKVLLVEDNFINQEVAVGLLELIGCDVVLAEDGRKGLQAFEGGNFDLVLLDCQMPEMDGYEAAQAMRQWEIRSGRSRTPIIALTANAFSSDRDRCLAAGMDDFLSKPIDRHALTERLERWITGEGSGSATKEVA